MSQFITLNEAIAMTTRYRNQKSTITAAGYQESNVLCLCETVERSYVETLLEKPDCQAIRIYYGMDEDLNVHSILVAVNSADEDILPPDNNSNDNEIVEESRRCPYDCPPPSPLNPE